MTQVAATSILKPGEQWIFLRTHRPSAASAAKKSFSSSTVLGVKGNGVHVFDRDGLLHRLGELGWKGCEPFVVQRCVAPPSLRNGRKWVMRAHALLHGQTDGRIQLYLHKNAICLEYGQIYTERLDIKAAHVSNSAKIKFLPKPEVIQDESIMQQLCRLTQLAFSAVIDHAPRGPFTPKEAELCQVFGPGRDSWCRRKGLASWS